MTRWILALPFALFCLAMITGCPAEEKSGVEETTDEVIEGAEDAAEETGDAIEDAADATGEALKDAADATGEALKDAGEYIEKQAE